ncbi:MAG TPA: hypothetical protein VLA56_03775 [Pseudomonadales bacterium]|nr:hypothetical protein [Pseudomonadales bacterium]
MKPMFTVLVALLAAVLLAACETPRVATAHCTAPLAGTLEGATNDVEERLATGCEGWFDDYFGQMLTIAEANPDAANRVLFSDFLVHQNERGTLSKRQAQALYNRYFGIKFVSLQGDYNTCSQTCPVRDQVMRDMRTELQHKERGLLRASADSPGFYRADTLLKETELVLEATCRACAAGGL